MEKQSEAKHKLKTSLCSHQVCWKALQSDQGVWNLKDHDATDQIQIINELSMTFYTTYGNPIIYQCG